MDRSRTCGRFGKRSCYLSEQAGRDPETHEVLKTKRKLEPMKVDLAPVAYKEIPDPTKVGDDMGLLSGTGKMVILIMAAIGILSVIQSRHDISVS